MEISFSRLMLLVWIAFLTPAMMTIRGSTCHTCALIASINGLYLSFFLYIFCSLCLSWVNVNYVICILWYEVGHMRLG